MKHLFIFLVSTAALISAVKATIPDYIHTCKRKDPNLSNCIRDNIDQIKSHLVGGIPDLGVPPIDPLKIDIVILDLGSGFKMSIQDMELSGLKDFNIHNVTASIERHTYSFDISIPEITVKGTYDVDAALASIPLKGTGPVTITAQLVTGHGTLHGKTVKNGDKIHYCFPSMNLILKLINYQLNMKNLFPGDPSIGEATNKVLNEEKDEVLRVLIPALEKAAIEKILDIASQICQRSTYDEMFPPS